MTLKKEFIPILLVILLGALLRFFKLGDVPPGLTLDEMGNVFNSYSISQTGKNVFGETLPFLTWMVPNGFPFMPTSIYTSVPVFWLFDLNSVTARLIPAILGILDIFLVYALALLVFKNRIFALLSAFFLAISPWHLHFARSAYDHNFALFFYLLGTVLFIYEVKKKRLPIFSIISFLLAVFSYRGMSIIAFPLFIALFWYGWKGLSATRRQLMIFLLGSLFVIFCVLGVSLKYGRSYTAEGQLLFANPEMQTYLDTQIREAEWPLTLRRFFLNKPTYILNKFRENYLRGYSPEYLFLYTEPLQIYSIWSRGRIYFIDVAFIILGVAFLFAQKKKEAIFITALLLIAGLPGGIGGFPISARNFFMSAILPIFTAGGMLFLYQQNVFRKTKKLLVIAFILLYGYALSSYLFDYYGRYSKIGGESWGKSFKDLSFKILENKDKYGKIVIGPTTHGDFIQFAFYAKLSAEDVQKTWLKSPRLHGGPFIYRNIQFVPECVVKKEESVLFITPDNCRKEKPIETIKDSFGNDIWKLYK